MNGFLKNSLRKLMLLFLDTKTGLSDSTPSSNTGIIVGVVMAAVVLILVVVLIICFRYRRTTERENTKDVVSIQNTAYEGDTQPDRELPQIPPNTDREYEEPVVYAQLDSSKRIPADENYQSLNVEGYEQLRTEPNENVPQYTPLNINNNLDLEDDGEDHNESVYEEVH